MKRALPLLVLAVALPGCGIGSDDATPSDESDIRSAMMTCFEDAGLEPSLEGEEGAEEIGSGSSSPRASPRPPTSRARARAPSRSARPGST
jgi:hypothetical protein